jgi:hypothetical protein
MSNQTQDVQASGTQNQKQSKVELSLDLVTMPVMPEKVTARHYAQGDKYTPTAGKHKGEELTRKRSNYSLPTVSDLTKAGVKDAVAVRNKMGLAVKGEVQRIVNSIANDNRVIVSTVAAHIDANGLRTFAPVFKQTTSKRVLAALLANGVPMKEAKLISAKYE